MKKRILSILLALCMLFCLVPTTAFAAGAENDKAIQLVDSGTAANISGGQNDNIYFGTWDEEPIKWRVLDDQTNTGESGLFLLSDALLGTGRYGDVYFDNSGNTSNAWQSSTAKTWCNNFYGSSFSNGEQGAVLATTKSDEALSTGGISFAASENILNGDKVFFLSAEEAENSAYGFTDDNARIANYGNSAGVWWLRSPYAIFTTYAGVVFGDGPVYAYVVSGVWAARPAFNLNLNSVLFASAAVGGKPDGGLTPISEYTGNEWKLTLKDSNRNFAVTETTVSGDPGDTVTLHYTGATAGINEYISVILADNSGAQYYGRVAQPTAENGTVEIKIPSGIAPGDYTLKVFNEQYNGDYNTDYASNFTDIALTVENQPDEQFTLAPGGTYYFDLSAMGIPGTVNDALPDNTLHYVPFTYAGTVDAYKLMSEMATTEEYAQQNKYPHSLFIADYVVTNDVSWDTLNTADLIFGKNYAGGGVDYTLRAPSVGSDATGLGDSRRGVPQSNEWDTMLNKNSGYIQNWNKMYSWGQDTSSAAESFRAYRGYNSARSWYYTSSSFRNVYLGFRPVLEVLNPDTLGSDGMKAVTLDLGGGTLGGSSDAIHIIVKTGSKFTAPASDGMTRPDGKTGSYFMWLDGNGNSYAPGDSVPADVTELTVQWTAPTYTVTLHANGGTINSGNVTGYTYGVGATLPTADDMTYTGHTFKGWYDNESLTGSPVTAIGGTETGNKEYWAKWEINQYTITVKPENGKADITITQDYGTNITAPADPTREGYTFMGWDREIPTTMPAENITLKARWKDSEKPTGEIVIGTNKWQEFLNKITFGLFFKDTQEVTINAADNSGTVFVSYLVTDQDLSEAELQSLVFSGYEEPFRIDPNGEYIVYAMLVDPSLNITYLRSDRVTVDNVQPVIGGIENGKTYCEAQTVTIDEKYVDTVTVNGTEVTLDENGSFILPAADGEQKIVATDKAGNTAEMTVTVNDGHTGGTATCTERAVCEVCGKAYGEPDPKNHTDLQHIPAKAATKTTTGNIEYWYCEDCGKYFADAAATKEIKQADTVTAKLSGAAKSPQTGGDSGVVTVLLLIGGAFICLVSRRKKRTHTV